MSIIPISQCVYGSHTLSLFGLKSVDTYASSLGLTGLTSWFGSHNLCILLETYVNSQNDTKEASSLFSLPRKILELGSGLGRTGMYASLLAKEGSRVLLTDGEDEVLKFLKMNVESNLMNNNKSKKAIPVISDCMKLSWGDENDMKAALEFLPGGADVFDFFVVALLSRILGADLIYGPEARQHCEALFQTVDTLLSRNKQVCAEYALPVFFFAYTKREGISLEEIEQIAAKHMLRMRMLDNFTFDIFDNNVTSQAMFWRDTIFCINRI